MCDVPGSISSREAPPGMCEADGEEDGQGVGASRLLEDGEVDMTGVHLPADMLVYDSEGRAGATLAASALVRRGRPGARYLRFPGSPQAPAGATQ